MGQIATVRRNGQAEMAAMEGVGVWWETKKLKPARLTKSQAVDLDHVRVAAGMDWDIGRCRVRYGNDQHTYVWEDQHVLFRKDTKEPLGIVSPSYQVVQPKQVLEFFSDVVGLGGARIETAGTMYGGRRFWAMARLSDAEDAVASGDVVRGYLLATTTADGSGKTTLTETTVCVVCENTMQMALREGGARISLGHRTELTPAVMQQLKTRLAETGKNFGTYMTTAKQLAKVKVSEQKAREFVETLLRDGGLMTAKDPAKSAGFAKIMDLFGGAQLGGDLKVRQGTAWGLVNAVTEYVDHHVVAKNPSIVMDSAWFGQGDAVKTAAIAKALELV